MLLERDRIPMSLKTSVCYSMKGIYSWLLEQLCLQPRFNVHHVVREGRSTPPSTMEGTTQIEASDVGEAV